MENTEIPNGAIYTRTNSINDLIYLYRVEPSLYCVDSAINKDIAIVTNTTLNIKNDFPESLLTHFLSTPRPYTVNKRTIPTMQDNTESTRFVFNVRISV